MTQSTCSIEGCGKPHLARGWCVKHYTRWRSHGTTEDPKPRAIVQCVGPECTNPATTADMCGTHDSQMRRKGELSPIRRRPRPVVDGRRQCRSCDAWLPVAHYSMHADSKYGIKGICRPCDRAEMGRWKAENPTYFTDWHKSNPDSRTASFQRRRAIVWGAESERVVRREVLDRDGWICGLCGDGIDSSLVWPHPLSPTLDHVVPLSRGGAHTYANTQAAHATCNLRKNDRMPEEMAALGG